MLRPDTHETSRQSFSSFSSHRAHLQNSHAGRLSVHEDARSFTVSLEFSHYDEESLDLWVEDHQLTLAADARSQGLSKGRRLSSFLSCIDLPHDIDEDTIQAELKGARLHVRFLKVDSESV